MAAATRFPEAHCQIARKHNGFQDQKRGILHKFR